MKSRSSPLLAPAHPSGPGKRTVKRLWCGVVVVSGVTNVNVQSAIFVIFVTILRASSRYRKIA